MSSKGHAIVLIAEMLFCVPACFGMQAPATHTQIPDVKQIRDIISDIGRDISAINVTYTTEFVNQSSESQPPSGSGVHCKVILCRPALAYSELAHFSPAMPWQDDPYSTQLFANGASRISFRPFARSYRHLYSKNSSELPSEFNQGAYLLATGIWPLQLALSDSDFWSLQQFAADKSLEILQAETVNEASSHFVLTIRATQDRTIVQYNAGRLLVLSRDTYDDDGRKLMHFDFSDFREVTPKLSLPWTIKINRFDAYAPTATDRLRTISTTLVRVESLAVNEVRPSAFTLQEPPGSIRIENDGSWLQVEAGGSEMILALTSWLHCYFVGHRDSSLGARMAWSAVLVLASATAVAYWRAKP